jgi:hypothetical protein
MANLPDDIHAAIDQRARGGAMVVLAEYKTVHFAKKMLTSHAVHVKVWRSDTLTHLHASPRHFSQK